MATPVIRLKNRFFSFWRQDSFIKDIFSLIIITILIGGAISFGLAWVVDAYFGDTVTGLIGDVGQYDLILHVREDAADMAKKELEKIIAQNFPGAEYKQAPTVAGRANFLLALPDEYKNREVLENIDSYFSTLPGGNGHTFIIAPVVTVRGVQFGAKGMLIKRLQELPGVKFAFVSGSNVLAVLTEDADSKAITQKAQEILDDYRTIEVRFPMGYQIKDISATGERLVMAIQDRIQPKLVKDVTLSEETSDMQAFLDALVEMKRFLLGYASEVEIKLDPSAALRVGDRVVLQGASPQPLVVGDTLRPDNLVVDIISIQGDTAKGIITQGDISDIAHGQLEFSAESGQGPIVTKSYRLERGTDIGQLVGETIIHNDRFELMLAIDESIKLLEELEVMAAEADETSQHLLATLDAYEDTLDQIARVEETLRSVNQSLDGPLTQLGRLNIDELVSTLKNTGKSIDYLLATMGLVNPPSAGQLADVEQSYSEVQGRTGLDQVLKDINPVVQLLRKFRERINQFALQVDTFGSLAENSDLVHRLMQDIGGATTSALSAMEQVDVDALRQDLKDITARLKAIGNLDTELVRRQMQDVRSTLPDLTDEEIGRSVRLIDRYIGGEVIPGERLEILVDSGVRADEVKPVIAEMLGTEDFSVLEAPIGTLQPDVRGILFSVLREVRSTIAGLTAVVFTLIILWLDHALIVTALRKLIPSRKQVAKGWARIWQRCLPDLAALYSGAVGGTVLLGSYLLSGGAIPLLSPVHILIIGVLAGLGTAALSERISPVSEAEIYAGLSLGMRKTDILREIVIPEGRPGISNLLNRRKLRFQ
ncbi:MAG: hypothetical protein H0Z38_02735 [Firmicutes bacterium]|nr:hypothetical protein [Bacillota bacterium]